MTFEEKKELMDKYERNFNILHPEVRAERIEFLDTDIPEIGIAITDVNGRPYIYIADRSETGDIIFDPTEYLERRGYTVYKKNKAALHNAHIEKDGFGVTWFENRGIGAKS